MEGFINNITSMIITFPILEIALYITEMIKFMPFFLTLIYNTESLITKYLFSLLIQLE